MLASSAAMSVKAGQGVCVVKWLTVDGDGSPSVDGEAPAVLYPEPG